MPETPATYDIEILGFSGVEPRKTVAALAKTFRIDRERAERLLDKVPVTVRTAAPRAEAERYTRALLAIGADVRVHGGGRKQVFRAAEHQSVSGQWQSDSLETGVAAPSGASSDAGAGAGAGVLRRQRSREEPAASTVLCPKCGFQQAEGDACVRCGVIFAKYAQPSDGDAAAERAAVLRHSRPTPPGTRAETSTGRHRSLVASAYVLSPEDDDGLFPTSRPSVDPGRIVREAAALSGVTTPVGRSLSGLWDSPGSAIRKPTGEAAERRRGSADVGFWDKIGRALAFSLRGGAYQWLGLMAILGALSYGVLLMMTRVPVFTMQLLGLFLLIVLFAAFLSAQWRFFHAAFHSAVADRDDEPPPVYGLEDFKSELVLPGLFLCLAALILWSPFLYVVFQAVESQVPPSTQAVILWALLPLVYWPMGMAWVSASGRLTEIFIVTGIVKGIVIGGIEYAFVATLGVLAYVIVNALVAAAGDMTVWAWALLYGLLGYVSGVQGYLLGRLLRRRPRMIAGTHVETTE